MAINEQSINEAAINAADETVSPLQDATDFAVVPARIASAVVQRAAAPANVPRKHRAVVVQSYNRTVVVRNASG